MAALIEFLVEWGYVGLFLSAFVAGSVIPFSSELVMFILLQLGLSPVICLCTATVGNTLGGMTCFWMGRLGKVEWIEKYFRVKKEKVDKMQARLQGRGGMMAFFAFLPIIGAILVIALGFMRSNTWVVLFSMFTGKLIRYSLILVAYHYGVEWLMSIYPQLFN